MTAPVRDLCPCGCGGEVPPVTGLGTTPFISVSGIKVYLATTECVTRCTCPQCKAQGLKHDNCITPTKFGRLKFCSVRCLKLWVEEQRVGA